MNNDRWDRLFEDLVRWEPEAWDPDEVAELARAERVGVTLAERVAGALDADITVTSRNGDVVAGRVVAVADGWCAVRTESADVVLTYATMSALGPLGAPRPGSRPVPLGVVLRKVAATGAPVVVAAGVLVRGVIVSVTADHLDVRDESGSVLTVPFGAIESVRATRNAV